MSHVLRWKADTEDVARTANLGFATEEKALEVMRQLEDRHRDRTYWIVEEPDTPVADIDFRELDTLATVALAKIDEIDRRIDAASGAAKRIQDTPIYQWTDQDKQELHCMLGLIRLRGQYSFVVREFGRQE